MLWEEKIERLKKDLREDFRIPYVGWAQILSSIEKHFVIENPNFRFHSWDNRLKIKQEVKVILTTNIEVELGKLDPSQYYWMILSTMTPASRNFVYDTKVKGIQILQMHWEKDFYIVEKKYKWLAYFRRGVQETAIFKAGNSATPFDDFP